MAEQARGEIELNEVDAAVAQGRLQNVVLNRCFENVPLAPTETEEADRDHAFYKDTSLAHHPSDYSLFIKYDTDLRDSSRATSIRLAEIKVLNSYIRPHLVTCGELLNQARAALDGWCAEIYNHFREETRRAVGLPIASRYIKQLLWKDERLLGPLSGEELPFLEADYQDQIHALRDIDLRHQGSLGIATKETLSKVRGLAFDSWDLLRRLLIFVKTLDTLVMPELLVVLETEEVNLASVREVGNQIARDEQLILRVRQQVIRDRVKAETAWIKLLPHPKWRFIVQKVFVGLVDFLGTILPSLSSQWSKTHGNLNAFGIVGPVCFILTIVLKELELRGHIKAQLWLSGGCLLCGGGLIGRIVYWIVEKE